MIPSAARCGEHPEVAAVDVCKRCGRFLCGDCVELVGEDAYCAACAAKVALPLSKVARLAVALALFGWGVVGVAVLTSREHPLGVLAVLLPGPAGLVAMVVAVLEWRRARRAHGEQRSQRVAFVALVLAAPLFLLMSVLVAYGVFMVTR
ncbi:MAG: hypothetical protein IPJ65_34495 [Archangiaceae bacterium]|nr:hypothetical protein [Archangiaceae bacterium]